MEEVLLLQTEFTPNNSAAMQRRGELVRHVLVEQLQTLLPAMRARSGIDDLSVMGKDGTGRKTEVPWTRIHSTSRSPRLTEGWYLVFLFSATGDRVYLSLIQGTTRWDGMQFKSQPEEQLRARAKWAREQVSPTPPPRWKPSINLDNTRSTLGTSYEWGTALAVEYDLDAIPSDNEITDDLLQASEWLGKIYRADTGLSAPGDSPFVADAVNATAGVANPRSLEGGFAPRLTAAQRTAIEKRAVNVTTAYFTSDGMNYEVRDVGSTESYDLHATKNFETIYIEVKGTTAQKSDIVLTFNEVELHRIKWPHNALAIVHGIHLSGPPDAPVATGGTLSLEMPWKLNESRLQPIAYRYSTAEG